MKYSLLILLIALVSACKPKAIEVKDTKNNSPLVDNGTNEHTQSNSPTKTHSETQSIDPSLLDHVYKAVLPCVDCKGIRTSLKLNSDGTVLLVETNLDSPKDIYQYTGDWRQISDGSIAVKYTNPNKKNPEFFKGTENGNLEKLERMKTPFSKDLRQKYILRKIR